MENKTYCNPVYDQYFADPFVLAHDGRYYAYATSTEQPGGRPFPVLESTNLIHWTLKGGALNPPAGGDAFWAPEVAYHDGKFYMYYSAHGVGGGDHRLRVAVSDTPVGPFEDRGKLLTGDEPFSIDAHPFRDSDGQWYLFYARDFLTLDGSDRVGTGIVVDRLVDMETLEGNPRVVVRPHADWQLFQAGREMYGQVFDWHTVEGPAMRVHNGRYYCFYSGGAWERENYGLAYVVADHPLGPYQRPNLTGPLMKTLPGRVIGPGHNSFVTLPSGQEYVVYHGWDPALTARLMRIDRLSWQGDTPVIEGPTDTEQVL